MLKRLVGGIGGLVVVVIVIALKFGAGWGIGFLEAKHEAPDVGKCVTVSGTSTDPDVDEATCGADDVLYKVMSDDGDCDKTEVSYTIEVTGGKDAADLCLFWAVEPGDCVAEGTTSDRKVDCDVKSTPAETIGKVVSVENGKDAKCGKKEIPFANGKRGITVCLVENT
jgi:hypothetical protein